MKKLKHLQKMFQFTCNVFPHDNNNAHAIFMESIKRGCASTTRGRGGQVSHMLGRNQNSKCLHHGMRAQILHVMFAVIVEKGQPMPFMPQRN